MLVKDFIVTLVFSLSGATGVSRSCEESRRVYGEKHDLNTAPHTQINGEHLRLCPQDYTCCSSLMEDTLARDSEDSFQTAVQDTSQFLLTTFTQRHRKFDEFFRELMDVAEKSMNEMYTQTYGHLYSQNANIFRRMFTDLRRYYTGGSVSLADSLADFWAALLQRVFKLVNPRYQFSEEYMECVSKNTEILRPFGDLPHKLHIQVSRALTAARSLVLALAAGAQIVNKATKLSARPECVRALMRQWFCPLCRGVPSLKPCHSLCLNVMKGCLANQSHLDSEWRNFIDALMVVVEKLRGPFNFELATDSITVTVSEGIMFMQENSVSISTKIFQVCGIPRSTPGRMKRSLRHREAQRTFRNLGSGEKPTTAAGTNLDRLVEELQERLRPMRGFWLALPQTICNDEQLAADVTNEDRCWNGQTRGRYLPEVTANGFVSQVNNPELEVDVSSLDIKTRQLLMELRVCVNRLKHAQLGRDPDFLDSDVEGGSGSAAGDQSFSDDWPGYSSYVPPRSSIDKPFRPREKPRSRDTAGGKRKRLNGRNQSDAARISLSVVFFSFCFALYLTL